MRLRRFKGLVIVLVLAGLVSATYAALTKSTTLATPHDDWQLVSPETVVDGVAYDVSGSYDTILYIEAALGEATASDGVEISVEISYADDDWTKLTQFKGTAETPAASTLNDAAATAGDADITLTDATAGDFAVKMRKWFILEGTVANSESVKTKANSTHTVTLCQDLIRSHTNGATVVDRVDEWCVRVPMAAAFVRVIVYNPDADCDAYFTSRVSKVTSLN